jgi:hypothetical protein
MRHQFRAPRRITPAMGVSLVALFLATGGTGYAALQVASGQIKDNSIQGRDIRDGTLKRADLADGLVNALKGHTGPAGPKGDKGDPGQKGEQGPKGDAGGPVGGIMWIDHFGFLPGDSSVTTTHNAVSSGVGGGLTALVISSSTTGEIANGGGNKEVQRALEVPPGYTIKRVRVCYENTSAGSFISQIRLAQIQPTPSSAVVRLDDATDLTAVGPVCVNSAATNVVASDGTVLISLRVNYASTNDKIALRGVGLELAAS